MPHPPCAPRAALPSRPLRARHATRQGQPVHVPGRRSQAHVLRPAATALGATRLTSRAGVRRSSLQLVFAKAHHHVHLLKQHPPRPEAPRRADRYARAVDGEEPKLGPHRPMQRHQAPHGFGRKAVKPHRRRRTVAHRRRHCSVSLHCRARQGCRARVPLRSAHRRLNLWGSPLRHPTVARHRRVLASCASQPRDRSRHPARPGCEQLPQVRWVPHHLRCQSKRPRLLIITRARDVPARKHSTLDYRNLGGGRCCSQRSKHSTPHQNPTRRDGPASAGRPGTRTSRRCTGAPDSLALTRKMGVKGSSLDEGTMLVKTREPGVTQSGLRAR